MLLLSCQELSRGFDAAPLFENVSFDLHHGERVGLVGPNGVGKTTLLKILVGHDKPDIGTVRHHAGSRVSLLRQQPHFAEGRTLFQEARSALNELLAAQEELVRVGEALALTTDEAQRKSLSAKYESLNELLHIHDAYNVDHKIEEVLDGLGFARSDYDRPVSTFSGGQQSRLMLAQLLLASPDVMLLDEPSNHLDIDTTRWLEDYLIRQPEAMIVVSHDRYFLDRVVNKIFEMSRNRITVYPGNFKKYWQLRQERYEQAIKAFEAQQEYIEKQEEYIRRVHYGQLHKQAASRQKQLDKIERVERPDLIDSPHMHFGEVRRSGDTVFDVENLAKSYDRPLFKDLSFRLVRGKRLGIMGPNGSGKTTLLRVLLGQESADKGIVQHGALVEVGYYDQHLKILDDNKTVLRSVWPEEDYEVGEQTMRNLLGRFGIQGDQIEQRVGALSGGERSRVALARLVASGCNVLVLDEPTNHLDLWACDALEQALLAFEGTAIVVSHDRYFLNRTIDVLLALDGKGNVDVIYGNYDTYEMMRAAKEADRAEAARRKEKENRPAVAQAATTTTKGKRKRKFPYRKVEDLEADIAATETTVRDLEVAMASPELYRDAGRVKQATQEFEAAKAKLAQLYEHWEEASELN